MAGTGLPADLKTGSTTRAAANGAASTVAVGDHLDPQGILALVVRGVAGLAQRIQAALLRTGGCGGEPGQLEDHPRAAIHLRQDEGHGRPFGGHLDLGTSSYVGSPGDGELPAIAAENDWRLSSCSAPASTASTARCGGSGSRTGTSGALIRGCAGAGSWGPSGSCTGTTSTTGPSRAGTTGSRGATARSANAEASDIASAHGSVPAGFDLTGLCVGGHAVVDAVVEKNVGIGHTADRAVLVVDRGGLPGHAVQVVVAPLPLHGREIHRLGLDEFRALDGVFGTDPGARVHQVRERSGLASGVVLVVPEGDIHHVMTVVVVLVATDREIRHGRLRQAAAIGLFRVSPGVADVLGLDRKSVV